MGTTKSRLIEVMDALGLKQYELSNTCEGITKNMLQNLWNSTTETVTTNVLEPFCKRYREVNCNWLLRGEGSMFLNTENGQFETSNKTSELINKIASFGDQQRQDMACSILLNMFETMRMTYEFFEKEQE